MTEKDRCIRTDLDLVCEDLCQRLDDPTLTDGECEALQTAYGHAFEALEILTRLSITMRGNG